MKILLPFISALLIFTSAQAQTTYTLSNGEITIEGTSTMHDWTATTTSLDGEGAFIFEKGIPVSIEKLKVTTKAKSIKSEKGSTMDKNMYKALNADKYPTLTFVLTNVDYFRKNGTSYDVKITGKLTVAGTTKTVSITGKGTQAGTGISFSGNFKLKMTDFNVEPPSLFFGTLNTGDDITIRYRASFSPTGYGSR
ncbi:MAG: hypothetical protein Kow0027_11150 [Saprospiraceae bacterium]